jgi:uncharacterized protein YeaO (DUF488 family)
MDIRIKRAYDAPAKNDGYRVLVDRVWPRGVSKEDAQFDAWLKDLAPSSDLRKWFGHDPGKWRQFKEKYFRELDGRRELVGELLENIGGGRATLVYGARDREHNNAVALKQYLRERKKESRD